MQLLKILGWLGIPFIMVILYWNKMNKTLKFLASAWAIFFLIIGFTNSFKDSSKSQIVTSVLSVVDQNISQGTNISTDPTITNTNNQYSENGDAEEVKAATPNLSESNNNSTQYTQVNQKQVNSPAGPATLSAHFIDVGQAAAVLFVLKDNNSDQMKTMLIDAGGNDDEQRIVEYIQNEGVSKLDVIIGTHPHTDHIGGLDAAVDAFEIGTIYMPKASSNTETFEDVLTAIANKNLKVNAAKAGVSIALDPSLDIELIGPVKNYDDLNDMSAVVRIHFGESSFLVTGDIEKTSEADIVASQANLEADVIQIPHHGSDTSSTTSFLEAVRPKYGVIQVGANNNYGHPTLDVLERLNEHNIKIYRNDLQGTVIFTSDGQTVSVSESEWKYVAVAASTKPTDKPDSNSKPTSTPKVMETPKTAPKASQEPEIDNVSYANCAAVSEAGKAPLLKGEPGYNTELDRDKDGVACE